MDILAQSNYLKYEKQVKRLPGTYETANNSLPNAVCLISLVNSPVSNLKH